MSIINFFEYVGLFAFSATGASAAIRKKFDILGIYIIATVTAIGGGVLRDIVTDSGIPTFFTDYATIPFILIPATIVIIIRGEFKYHTLFTAIDAVGLAAFVVATGLKAIENEYNFMLFIFVTLITGVGGGIMRDILINQKPTVFTHDVYATAALIGAIVLWLLCPIIGRLLSAYISLAVIVAVRMVCYIKNINLPVIEINHSAAKLLYTSTNKRKSI